MSHLPPIAISPLPSRFQIHEKVIWDLLDPNYGPVTIDSIKFKIDPTIRAVINDVEVPTYIVTYDVTLDLGGVRSGVKESDLRPVKT